MEGGIGWGRCRVVSVGREFGVFGGSWRGRELEGTKAFGGRESDRG